MKKIKSFKNAKLIYNFLSKKRELLFKEYQYYLKKEPYLINANFFDRDIFLYDSCKIDTLYLYGKFKRNISNDLEISLSNGEIFAYFLGELSSQRFFSKSFVRVFIRQVGLIFISFIKLIINISISVFDIFFIIIYCIFKILVKKFNRK